MALWWFLFYFSLFYFTKQCQLQSTKLISQSAGGVACRPRRQVLSNLFILQTWPPPLSLVWFHMLWGQRLCGLPCSQHTGFDPWYMCRKISDRKPPNLSSHFQHGVLSLLYFLLIQIVPTLEDPASVWSCARSLLSATWPQPPLSVFPLHCLHHSVSENLHAISLFWDVNWFLKYPWVPRPVYSWSSRVPGCTKHSVRAKTDWGVCFSWFPGYVAM